MAIYKIITKNEASTLDYDSLVCFSTITKSEPHELAFMFPDDNIPEFFNDKTSYAKEEFEAMTRDPSSKWYLG